MNKREKYIKASKLIATGREGFCCTSLRVVDMCPEEFKLMFHPIYENAAYSLDYGYAWYGNDRVKENQLARSLALLFMAELDK